MKALTAGKPLEVAVDELLCLLLRYLEAVGEAVRRQAVDDAVVDHLGLGPGAGIGLAPQDLRGRGGVHVLAAAEDVLQHLLVRDVREQPQLDLRVVRGDQAVALLGHEAGADLAPQLRADRDVLEVRVRAREPAGGGRDLAEGRVQPRPLVHEAGERVEVGGLELRELAPLLDLRHDFVLVPDRLEHAGVGREARLAAPLLGQPELLEQHHAELLRRADRELLPRQLPDLPLELVHLGPHALGDLLQLVDVELDPRALHVHQHVHQRQLDVVQEVREAVLLEPHPLALRQHACDHGPLGHARRLPSTSAPIASSTASSSSG